MTKEQRKDISKHIKSQKGQKYPCGNQVVCCGYFSYEEDWEKFCKKNKYKAVAKVCFHTYLLCNRVYVAIRNNKTIKYIKQAYHLILLVEYAVPKRLLMTVKI